MPDDRPESLQPRLEWHPADEIPFLFVNQLIAQVNQGEVFLTFGQVSPPVILGTPEEQRRQLSELESVPVRPIARLSMTPERLEEIIGVLVHTVERHRQQQEVERASATGEDQE